MHKCYACGRARHFAGDKVCPAKGKLCTKCGKRGNWAACCRNEADGKGNLGKIDGGASGSNDWRSCKAASGRILKPRGQQIYQVDYGSEEEPFAFPINYNVERVCEDNVIAVKINGTMTSMLVYSGAQFTVSGLRGNLISEERNLRVYQYGNECLTRWSVNVKLQLNAKGKKWWKLFS